MDKISLFHGQKFAISEFSWYIEYDFLKEDHKNNFHTKNQEDSQRRLEVRSKTLETINFGQKNGQILALMAKNSPYQNFPGIQSMISAKRTITTTSKAKIRKIHNGVQLQSQNSKIGLKWTEFRYSMVKNSPYQNFAGIQSRIFSKRTITTPSIPKIRTIHSGVWKLKAKNLQNCQFWQKNGQILVARTHVRTHARTRVNLQVPSGV